MTNASDNDGFLGRWSRRKIAVRGGQTVAEPEALAPTPEPQNKPHHTLQKTPQDQALAAPTSATRPAAADPTAPVSSETPPPTLEDAQQLTPQSDFKPFMARNVSPEVKNTALKKLFTDPHFNKMDMLDVYVDDYGKPDPIPASMLRQLASAKFLKLFDEEEKPAQAAQAVQADAVTPVAPSPQAAPVAGDDANASSAANVAQSDLPHDARVAQLPAVTPSEPSANNAQPATTHDHPDLQLQPNHAAGRPSPGPSAG
jgi:Protein of unknown function (DUF3306)